MADERRVEVSQVRVDLICKCGGTLAFTGMTLTSNPPWYVHKCDKCGEREDTRRISGGIEYHEEVPRG